jgi:hypothetical protein
MRLYYYLIRLETVRSISSNNDTVVVVTFLTIISNTEVLLLTILDQMNVLLTTGDYPAPASFLVLFKTRLGFDDLGVGKAHAQ